MKLTGIKIQNVLGVTAADITLAHPINLVAGKNFAGKSSVQEAVRMALTGETVRVALKKEYGRLVTEGQDVGFSVVEIEDGQAAMTLPNGAHELTSALLKIHERALPYVLDAQRFARLTDQERRAFLFGLMGLSADGPAVKQRLEAKGCDAKKIEAIMPILRAGFAAACEDAKGKATAAKGAWRAVTGETYGAKKAIGWKAAKPDYDAAALDRTNKAMADVEIQITKATESVGDLQGQARRYAEQKQRLSDLRERAGHYARIQDKLNRDEAELKQWQEKVEETRAKASGTTGKPQTFTCPCCGVVLEHRLADGALIEYVSTEQKADAEAVDKLPEYEKALALMESAVANGRRDLAASDTAAKALRELEDAGLTDPPDEEAITVAKRLLEDLKQTKTNHQAHIRTLEEAARAAAAADKKTTDAAQHHADVAAWDLVGDALAPDGIPGDMLAEALGPINDRLAQSAADSGWMTAIIDHDMSLYTTADTAESGVSHHRPYSLLSESEKYRVDAMLAEAISHLSGTRLMVLDRFDVLDVGGRGDLLSWLDVLAANDEIDTALIFGTLKALPAELPATTGAHWIEAGVMGKLKAAA